LLKDLRVSNAGNERRREGRRYESLSTSSYKLVVKYMKMLKRRGEAIQIEIAVVDKG